MRSEEEETNACNIFDIIWNSGEKCLQPATTTTRRWKIQNCISKFFGMEKLKHLLNLNGNCSEIKGHTIDKLHVSSTEIAKGSNGTVEYLVSERRVCSLSELVPLFAANSDESCQQDIYLWKGNGYPSQLLLKLMRDMVEELVHLHELGIIHQDIKPENVMIATGIGIRAKLSGSSRGGSVEKKLHKRQRWSSDMFSLGCVFYFCLSRGGQPFNQQLEDDTNNGINRTNINLVNHIPEAKDLISHLLDSNPKMRPKAKQVLHHPLFWDSDKRVSFLRDVSDCLERETRNSKILIDLESVANRVFGARWDRKMESELVKDISRSRYYKYRSLQHLLRVVRNKLNHYHQSSKNIQELLGPVPEGFDDYFSSRFPRLLMEVYKVVIHHCRSEKCFEKYFGVDSVSVA